MHHGRLVFFHDILTDAYMHRGRAKQGNHNICAALNGHCSRQPMEYDVKPEPVPQQRHVMQRAFWNNSVDRPLLEWAFLW